MSAPAPAVVLVDAGLGNLRSVEKALRHVGGAVTVTDDPARVRRAARVVVPGQGAFGDCERALSSTAPLGEAILEGIRAGRPYLGICLGLQVLFPSSEEAPGARGFGLFDGAVVKIAGDRLDGERRRKVPHMGWNEVVPRAKHPLLDDAPTHYYFAHSYVAAPADARVVAATVDYGSALVAAVARGPLFAVQFHPEKSQHAGLRLLERFLRWNG